mmetsp:Transcript_167536/g.537989  ORF Transcript_167536/g.537989 Transcript_167536/m.537989 type:complete len:228 (-) Transcript_167536:874-1557(-)
MLRKTAPLHRLKCSSPAGPPQPPPHKLSPSLLPSSSHAASSHVRRRGPCSAHEVKAAATVRAKLELRLDLATAAGAKRGDPPAATGAGPGGRRGSRFAGAPAGAGPADAADAAADHRVGSAAGAPVEAKVGAHIAHAAAGAGPITGGQAHVVPSSAAIGPGPSSTALAAATTACSRGGSPIVAAVAAALAARSQRLLGLPQEERPCGGVAAVHPRGRVVRVVSLEAL